MGHAAGTRNSKFLIETLREETTLEYCPYIKI
jgi:hypothetical protein